MCALVAKHNQFTVGGFLDLGIKKFVMPVNTKKVLRGFVGLGIF